MSTTLRKTSVVGLLAFAVLTVLGVPGTGRAAGHARSR